MLGRIKQVYKEWINQHNHNFTKLMLIIKPFFLGYAVFYSIQHPDHAFNYWMVALIVCFIMIVVGTDIGLHRYFAHKAFDTSPAKRFILEFISIPCMSGSALSWAVVHRKHHAECDTEGDPHSPNVMPWWRVWFYLKPSYFFDQTIDRKYYRGLISDRRLLFTHNYYFPILLGYMIIIYLLFGWQWVLFGLIVPSTIVDFQMAWVNVVCHLFGYESFKTKKQCKAKNNWLVHCITFFSFGYHNNHHADAGNYRTNKNPGEFDIPAWIIETFFLSKEDREKIKRKKQKMETLNQA
jgi:stearoyl-CoA desaturase (delta-9 desaturase)